MTNQKPDTVFFTSEKIVPVFPPFREVTPLDSISDLHLKIIYFENLTNL